MSRLRLLALAALAAPAFAGEPRTLVLAVGGMTCSLCPITVRKALERVPGMLEAKADYATRRAEAKYDPDRTTPQALVKAVNDAGFTATVQQ
jgi:mercuric ion binding protein